MNKAIKVHELMKDSLNGSAEGALVVDGIAGKYGFDSSKIALHKDEIRALLDDMPDDFHAAKGGGMSFLNLCVDKSGEQWAEHSTMDALVALGIAAGMARYPLPRELWSIFPGGMPYVTFDTALKETAP